MANNQTFRGSASLSPPTVATILNETSPVTPMDQFSILLPDNTKRFIIKPRTDVTLLLAYDVSFAEYFTIPKRNSYSEDNIILNNTTIYLKSSGVSSEIEVITWQ